MKYLEGQEVWLTTLYDDNGNPINEKAKIIGVEVKSNGEEIIMVEVLPEWRPFDDPDGLREISEEDIKGPA